MHFQIERGKEMKKSKIFALILCTAFLSVTTVLGTLAYLTSRDSVANTFTVGDVQITLDEHPVDENGKQVADCPAEGCVRVKENQYHVVPGETYDKDPMVTVKADSEPSYVRMIMTVHNASAVQAIVDNSVHQLNDYADLFAGWDQESWLYEGFEADAGANTIAFEFRYFDKNSQKDVADASGLTEDLELPALFTQLVVPGTVTNAELKALYGNPEDPEGDFKIVVEAHAIQAATFADADAAWAAFDVQNASN